MEEILGQKMRTPISLRQFLDDYRKGLENKFIPVPVTELDIQTSLDLLDEPERFHVAAENCALEHLQQLDDVRVTKFVPGFTELNRRNINRIGNNALKLRTFNLLLKSKEITKQRNPFKRSHESYKWVLPRTGTAEGNNEEDRCYPNNEIMVTVRVYRQARATHVGQSLEKPVFAEEFECLGSNFLTELRDKITCVCNNKRFFDISENPNGELPSKETDPGYFFITDTFYNDKRNPNNADYSETIRCWAKQAIGLKDLNFKIAQMEQTRFIDLTVSIGFPQLYQHHGNCEHVFIISQVEVITPSTLYFPNEKYPRLRTFNVFNKRLCNMCGTVHYNFIVEKSDRLLHDPAYLCSKCFFSFHYIDGKKIGQFKAYRVVEFIDEECAKHQDKEENSVCGSISTNLKSLQASDDDDDFELLELDTEQEFTTIKKEKDK